MHLCAGMCNRSEAKAFYWFDHPEKTMHYCHDQELARDHLDSFSPFTHRDGESIFSTVFSGSLSETLSLLYIQDTKDQYTWGSKPDMVLKDILEHGELSASNVLETLLTLYDTCISTNRHPKNRMTKFYHLVSFLKLAPINYKGEHTNVVASCTEAPALSGAENMHAFIWRATQRYLESMNTAEYQNAYLIVQNKENELKKIELQISSGKNVLQQEQDDAGAEHFHALQNLDKIVHKIQKKSMSDGLMDHLAASWKKWYDAFFLPEIILKGILHKCPSMLSTTSNQEAPVRDYRRFWIYCFEGQEDEILGLLQNETADFDQGFIQRPYGLSVNRPHFFPDTSSNIRQEFDRIIFGLVFEAIKKGRTNYILAVKHAGPPKVPLHLSDPERRRLFVKLVSCVMSMHAVKEPRLQIAVDRSRRLELLNREIEGIVLAYRALEGQRPDFHSWR
jgi:hypothetical protein